MTKSIFSILILCGTLLQSCSTYERSFGETFTRIDIDNYSKLYRLDLSNQELQVAPIMLDQLVELRMLNLSGNKQLNLKQVLETIPNPELLEVLILDSLDINNIPESILRFKSLKHLSLNFNPNIDIEKTIISIVHLPFEFLNIQHNNLVTLPSKITDIKTLTAVNLSYNQISNPEVFQFSG
jgi:Leucine-rich repeat (LRR) protein